MSDLKLISRDEEGNAPPPETMLLIELLGAMMMNAFLSPPPELTGVPPIPLRVLCRTTMLGFDTDGVIRMLRERGFTVVMDAHSFSVFKPQ